MTGENRLYLQGDGGGKKKVFVSSFDQKYGVTMRGRIKDDEAPTAKTDHAPLQREQELGRIITAARNKYYKEHRERVTTNGMTEEEIQEKMTENIRADRGPHLRGADALAARNELVTRYLNLPGKVAQRYLYKGITFDDLIQYGELSLIGAAERFDPDNVANATFMTFAAKTINGDLKKVVERESSMVKLPRGMIEDSRVFKRAHHRLERQAGESVHGEQVAQVACEEIFERDKNRKPTKEELATAVKEVLMDVPTLLHGRAIMEDPELSRGDPSEEGSSGEIFDTIPTKEDVAETATDRAYLDSIFAGDTLNPKQKKVLGLHYLEELTHRQIAARPDVPLSKYGTPLSHSGVKITINSALSALQNKNFRDK